MDTKTRPVAIDQLRIDGQRLWDSLMELAKIGATPKGGVCRLTLTDLDRQGRDLVTRWAREAGLTITIDKIGNGFMRRPGRNNALPPVVTGSHIDTQPTGGKFDGNYGVLAGLEVVPTLNDHGIETEAPIEVAFWTNDQERVTIPRAELDAVVQAAAEAVKAGQLWLTAGDASVLSEAVPTGLLTHDAIPQAPPPPLQATDVLRENLPEAWPEETTTALVIARALSTKAEKPLPWPFLGDAIDGAIRSRLLEVTVDSSSWPCEFSGASGVRLAPPSVTPQPLRLASAPSGSRIGESELRIHEFQDFVEHLAELKKATIGHDLKLIVRIEVGGRPPVGDDVVGKVNDVLARVSERLKLK